jgi:hypothetical protein
MKRTLLFSTLAAICFFVLLCFPLSGQDRFSAGMVLGLNAAQLDGDDQSGYSRSGLHAGLRACAELSGKVYFSVELIYSQRGAKPPSNQASIRNPVTIRLNYAEVPFLLNIYTGKQKKSIPGLHLNFGLSYSRLLNSKVEEYNITSYGKDKMTYVEKSENFRSNDLNLIIGGIYFFNPNFGFGLRHSYSLSPVFRREDFPEKQVQSLRSYHLTFSAVYML